MWAMGRFGAETREVWPIRPTARSRRAAFTPPLTPFGLKSALRRAPPGLPNMLRYLVALLLAGATFAAGAQDDVRLPDFGSSAGGIISPDEERRIGETMLRELRGLNYILDDPELSD